MNRTLSTLTFGFFTASILIFTTACDPKKEAAQFQNFPHKIHAEQEISCDSCHEIQPETVSMPTLETCLSCHEIEDEQFFGKCNTCHAEHKVELTAETGDKMVSHEKLFRKVLPENWSDVKYNHAKFLTAESDCLACHSNIPKSERSQVENLPSMETSMAFHDKMGYSNDCAMCHLELTVFTPPASHNSMWDKQHGRKMVFEDKQQCLMCHQEETCTVCHDTQKPSNHTNLFRRKSHGMLASFDRGKCLVCHRSDECEACHQAAADPVPPAPFHTPDASCLTCHSPAAGEFAGPRPPQRLIKPMPHRMMMGVGPQQCLQCHQF